MDREHVGGVVCRKFNGAKAFDPGSISILPLSARCTTSDCGLAPLDLDNVILS